MKKEKVGCKFCNFVYIDDGYRYCTKGTVTRHFNFWDGEESKYSTLCKNKNKDGDCPDFGFVLRRPD